MLIRSQDRKILIPLNRPINVFDRNVVYCDEAENSDGYPLGTYDSPARCLEILDEIQSEFMYNNHFSGSGANNSTCQTWKYGIYQMPEK